MIELGALWGYGTHVFRMRADCRKMGLTVPPALARLCVQSQVKTRKTRKNSRFKQLKTNYLSSRLGTYRYITSLLRGCLIQCGMEAEYAVLYSSVETFTISFLDAVIPNFCDVLYIVFDLIAPPPNVHGFTSWIKQGGRKTKFTHVDRGNNDLPGNTVFRCSALESGDIMNCNLVLRLVMFKMFCALIDFFL